MKLRFDRISCETLEELRQRGIKAKIISVKHKVTGKTRILVIPQVRKETT